MKPEKRSTRVEDMMTRDVSCCDPGTSASAAAEIMWTRNCGALPVVDRGLVVGMITDRDLFIALGTSNRNSSDLSVGEIMNSDLASCRPTDEIASALQNMSNRAVRRLPVTEEDGTLKGMLSLYDIVVGAESCGVTSDDIVQAMRAICDPQFQSRKQSQAPRSKRAVA